MSLSVAYLILAHGQPAQLGRLVARLNAPGVRCYLHIDARTDQATFDAIKAAMPATAAVTFIARRPCRWGGFSLVDATLDLVRAALKDGFDWAQLLSGADYPIKTTEHISAWLTRATAAGFIDLRAQDEFDVRYRWQAYFPEQLNGTRPGKVLQKLQRGLNRLGLRRSLPAPLTRVWAGSQWWCLSQSACKALIGFVDQHPQVPAFFRSTLVPDEMFVQTVLMATACGPELASHNLHQLRWQENAWSPAEFTAADVPQLIASPALFARKFSPDGDAAAALDAALNITHSV
ncbi:beta-1,6-N-acetylglucosaminyltransferase [Silvimonas iriomotensis]|uniref:Peptide O-xylosyltransferase n=1 Tax=Silvimonas iriomotensis TaxID=449662 RepID=A0ABQ2PE74_9NEIS|nr:beta-1,6-N-acetylglucosaminyltransferase [Silvimonas iriomotensis]GGP23616.1 hypothetical protein GCM10010970_36160 [Silvimonas iriomotensis]